MSWRLKGWMLLTLALVVRRAFGLVAGSLAGLLLATNMLEVWQAKYQTAHDELRNAIQADLGIPIE